MPYAPEAAPIEGPISVQSISQANREHFKAIRLRALRDAPSAFGSTYEREVNFTEAEWGERIERFSGRKGAGYLAIGEGVPCGIAGCLVEAGRVELVSMWVAPAMRRRGVGRVLVDEVCGWAKGLGFPAVHLMVTSTNTGAKRFYGQLGFLLTGRTKPYPNDPAIDELEMARLLG